jgi:linoleate 10R-lipoxygenase
LDHSLFERGRGNVVSVEFNCLYRWHATTSVEDAEWIQKQLEVFFPGKDINDVSTKSSAMFKILTFPPQVTFNDFKKAMAVYQAREDKDASHWVFGQ